MKIQVIQTLSNGQVTQKTLSKDDGMVLKVQVQPGAKLGFTIEISQSLEDVHIESKTTDIKKVGNNLVLESEGEPLVEVTDFYNITGASIGDVTWNYAVQETGVMPEHPTLEAQALASGVSPHDISSDWLLPVTAASVATLASVGGGGS